MREIFDASYKSFYLFLIALLWFFAIFFALLQSKVTTSLVGSLLLPKLGVEVGSIEGGLLSGVELRGVRYKDILNASEVRFDIVASSLLTGELEFAYLDIKNLKIDSTKLNSLLQKEKNGVSYERYLSAIKIENGSLHLIDFSYGDIVLDSLTLDVGYLYYNFEHFYADFEAQVVSNILDATLKGEALDNSYEARGVLSTNGSDYVNKLVGDSDFDFNAIGRSDFLVRGNMDSIYLKAHIKSTKPIYKYTVDATVRDLICEASLNFSTLNLKVDAIGEVDSRYALLDSKFSVIYDGNKTRYFGKAKALKFHYIPLGHFAKSIQIESAKNSWIKFDGDAREVFVETKNELNGLIEGKRVVVRDALSKIGYKIKEGELSVDTTASLFSDYLDAKLQTTVIDISGKTKFDGSAYDFSEVRAFFAPDLLSGGRLTFSGDTQRLFISLDSKKAKLSLVSNGYDKYDIKANLNGATLLREYSGATLKGLFFGSYLHSKGEMEGEVVLDESVLFGKKLSSETIKFKKNTDSLFISESRFRFGGVGGTVGAKTEGGVVDGHLKTAGVELLLQGVLGSKMNFVSHIDIKEALKEYVKIVGGRAPDIGGNLSFLATVNGKFEDKNIDFNGFSNSISVGEERVEGLLFMGELRGDTLSVKKLEGNYKNRLYMVTNTPKINLSNGASCDAFSINNSIFGSFAYKNGDGEVDFRVEKFDYSDKSISFLVDAVGKLRYKNNKAALEADAKLYNLKTGFDLKSSKIVKDRDIIILKPKEFALGQKGFFENLTMRINITNANEAIFASKEAKASMDLNLLYYKDFDKEPMMVGLINVKNGYYSLEGKRFLIERGDIVLTQSEPNDPYLDLVLSFKDRDKKVNVYVREFASAPKISFSSNPAMSEREIISFLLFGVDPDTTFTKGGDDSKYSQKAIGALSNILSRDIAKEFGIKFDKIEITPTEVAGQNGRSVTAAKIEIGKRVTRDLTVTYKNDIESSVVFEYQINKNMSVESQAGRKSSIDIFYKQDY